MYTRQISRIVLTENIARVIRAISRVEQTSTNNTIKEPNMGRSQLYEPMFILQSHIIRFRYMYNVYNNIDISQTM